jgi:PAS domain S-box-containing protein
VDYSDDVRITLANGDIRHLAVRGFIERAPDGEPLAITGVTMDVTKAKRAEQVLRESEARYRLLAENVSDIIAQMDLAGVIRFVTPACERVLGYGPEDLVGRRMLDFMHPGDKADVLATMQALIDRGPDEATVAIQYRARHKDGRWIWIEGQPKVLFDAAGTPTGLQDAVRDISERKAAEERQTLMVHELNHRVKNTLATMQSLARQTMKSVANPEAFAEAFDARLLALSHNHDLLTQNSWAGASVRELAEAHLKPYQDATGDRFCLAGPEVRVTPNAAVSLGMVFGELTTNAAKYGALSSGDGTVEIKWRRGRGMGGPWLRLVWRERGGPAVLPPTRQGFGRRLIEQLFPRELGGRVQLTFKPRGVMCEIDLPLPASHPRVGLRDSDLKLKGWPIGGPGS